MSKVSLIGVLAPICAVVQLDLIEFITNAETRFARLFFYANLDQVAVDNGVSGGSVWLWIVLFTLLLLMSLVLMYQTSRRRILEENLKRAVNGLSTYFDAAPCGYYSLDNEGIIQSINQTLCEWLEYEKNDIVGKMKFATLVDPEAVIDNQWNATHDKKHGSLRLYLKPKTGVRVPVVIQKMEGSTSQDGLTFYSAINNSDCENAFQRIRNLDQELEAFSYSISHDLRAPLRSIDGYSRILSEDYSSKLDAEGNRVLNVIVNNARRMGKLIDDLLDFGRLGRKGIQRSQLNMTGIAKSIAQELKSQEPTQKINIRIEELHPAYADGEMIRQVWYNLLENAIKYSSKKDISEIVVRSSPCVDDRGICYEVRDNGVGFDMKYASKLFGVFQRLHKVQDFGGTGVGLAIVKRIISRHGGRVWADSKVNEGATFFFTIPGDDENA